MSHLRARLRLEAQPLASLSKALLRTLGGQLTNSKGRGDLLDDGTFGGSGMLETVAMALQDRPTADAWAITCWVDAPLRAAPLAWCTLATEGHCHVPTLGCAFYVAPGWRRRGLGRLLVNEGTRLAHQLGYRRLIGFPWNSSSSAFYSGLGFDIVSTQCGSMTGLAELAVPDQRPKRMPWVAVVPPSPEKKPETVSL